MNGKLLLDTNAIIAIFARDQKVHKLLVNALFLMLLLENFILALTIHYK